MPLPCNNHEKEGLARSDSEEAQEVADKKMAKRYRIAGIRTTPFDAVVYEFDDRNQAEQVKRFLLKKGYSIKMGVVPADSSSNKSLTLKRLRR
jgi:hypothetical protein